MTPTRLALPIIAALLAVVPASCAQESAASDPAVRAHVAGELPAWWTVQRFEVIEREDGMPLPASPGKGPELAPAAGTSSPASGGKPGAGQNADARVIYFTATLELTDRIYEPLYNFEGTAIVRPIMEEGDRIDVTGSLTITGEGGAATYGNLHFDQGGLVDIGRPLDGFDVPAVILGSEEADAYFAERDTARAEGTMRKIMSDTGEEL